MMSKPKKKLWLARDKVEDRDGSFNGDYTLFQTKPVRKWNNCDEFYFVSSN